MAPEPVLSTLRPDGGRRWLYPTLSPGRYWRVRRVVGWALIVFYIALPLIRLNGSPAVLLDAVHGEFALLGLTFYPTDAPLAMLALIGALLTVFLATALYGRLWCGWACPQTVYLEFLFRPLERLIEGREPVRKLRDNGPLTVDKAWRKAVKWTLYGLISLVLAHTFVAYFVGWDRLLGWMGGSPLANWGYFVFMALTTGLVLFNFGVFREQMCTVACPYARLQSVLIDDISVIVAYDRNRGEPRGKGKRDPQKETPLGDCIDCGACVRTCPVGIDIRDGLQMECIGCTQCIDACDEVMDRVELPRGLIRYTSEAELAHLPARRLRPRVVLYGSLLIVLAVALVGLLIARRPVEVSLTRSIGEPFTTLPTGEIANRLTVRVRNRTGSATAFTVAAESPAGARVQVVGLPTTTLEPGALVHLDLWFIVPPGDLSGGSGEGRLRLRFTGGDIDGRVELPDPLPLIGPSAALEARP